jgi:hypothetical protein
MRVSGSDTADRRALPDEPAARTPAADAPDEHDRSLIVERVAWTPEQRLDANTAFLQFYLAMRPSGPLIENE